MSLKIHHVGYLVKNITKAITSFICLGYYVEKETMFDEYRGISICFLIKDGYRIELVSPATDGSVVSNLIKKYGNSPYHICYISDDFNNDCNLLTRKGFKKLGDPLVAPACENKEAIFFTSRIGLVEVIRG